MYVSSFLYTSKLTIHTEAKYSSVQPKCGDDSGVSDDNTEQPSNPQELFSREPSVRQLGSSGVHPAAGDSEGLDVHNSGLNKTTFDSNDGNGMTCHQELVPGHDITSTSVAKQMTPVPAVGGSTTTTAQQHVPGTHTMQKEDVEQQDRVAMEDLIKVHTHALRAELVNHIQQKVDESAAQNKRLVERENERLRQEMRDLKDEFDRYKRNTRKKEEKMRKVISEKEKQIEELQRELKNLLTIKEESEEKLLQKNKQLSQEVAQLRKQLTINQQDDDDDDII